MNKFKVEIIGVNRAIVSTDEGEYLISYSTTVIFKSKTGEVLLNPKWDSSNSTKLHCNIFLKESTQVIKDNILNGNYELNSDL